MRFIMLKYHQTIRNLFWQLLTDLISSCGCPSFKAFSLKLHTYPANLCKSDQICWNRPEEHAKDVSLCISMDFNNARALEVTMMPFHSIYNDIVAGSETSIYSKSLKHPTKSTIWWLSLILASNEWNEYKHQSLTQKRNHRDLTQWEFEKCVICYPFVAELLGENGRFEAMTLLQGPPDIGSAAWWRISHSKQSRLLAPARHHSSPRKNCMWVVSVVGGPIPVVQLVRIDTSTPHASTVACYKARTHLWKQTLMNTTNTTQQFPKGFDSAFRLFLVVPSSELLDHSCSKGKHYFGTGH